MKKNSKQKCFYCIKYTTQIYFRFIYSSAKKSKLKYIFVRTEIYF